MARPRPSNANARTEDVPASSANVSGARSTASETDGIELLGSRWATDQAAQVYPGVDARPGLTGLSRLRHRLRNGEGAFVHVQLRDDVRACLEETRNAVR